MTLDDAISEQWHSLAIEEQSAIFGCQYAEEVESVGLIVSLAVQDSEFDALPLKCWRFNENRLKKLNSLILIWIAARTTRPS